MPASMIAPVECPSLSTTPPSDSSGTSSPINGDDAALDLEDRLSPSPWQDRRGEVNLCVCVFLHFFFRFKNVPPELKKKIKILLFIGVIQKTTVVYCLPTGFEIRK